MYSINEKGITLIELMIAAAIISVVSIGAYSNIQRSMYMEKETVEKANILEVSHHTFNFLRDTDFLNMNRALNSEWNNCYNNVASCGKTGSKYSEIKIDLFKKRDNSLTKITGKDNNPVYYGKNGEIVDTFAESYFSVTSKVIPFCAFQCTSGQKPEAMVYQITVAKRQLIGNRKGDFRPFKTFQITEELKAPRQLLHSAFDCGKSDATYFKFSTGSNSGVLNCNWTENTASLPAKYKGDKGKDGVGITGATGRKGQSRCHAENVAALLSRDTLGYNSAAIAQECNP